MFTSLRRSVAPVLALAVLTSVLAFAPRASAEEAVYEAEGAIAGFNPLSSDVGGVTETSFLLACAVPPSQGVDGFVFELPEEFGAGDATMEVTGSDLTGVHDLDAYFYTADCSSAGDPIATAEPDEAGPIPADTAWVVVNAWLGTDTAVSFKATRPVGKQVVKVALGGSAKKIHPGQGVKISGSVTGCSPRSVEIYSRDGKRGLVSRGTSEVDEKGNFTKKVKPSIATTYFADVSDKDGCLATRSNRFLVKVSPKIVIAKNRRCQSLKGRITPKQSGSTVKLQRWVGSWRTVDSDRVNSRSRFQLDYDYACRGNYRVRWIGPGSNLSPTSRRV